MAKQSKCDGCGLVTETFKGKHGSSDKRFCRKCQRKLVKEQRKLGQENPNMVR